VSAGPGLVVSICSTCAHILQLRGELRHDGGPGVVLHAEEPGWRGEARPGGHGPVYLHQAAQTRH